jgi:hypothetical protein
LTPLWLIKYESNAALQIRNGKNERIVALNADYGFLFHSELAGKTSFVSPSLAQNGISV